jgi:diguanylate cyclase (GGDEF)-like protein
MPKSIHNLQLKKKFLLILSVSVLLIIPPLIILYLYILFPTYDEIEKSTIKINMKRVLNSILKETTHLDNLCYTWTLGYDVKKERNISWMKDKVVYQSFAAGDFEFICLVDKDIRIIFAEGYDIVTGTRRVPAAFADTAAIKNGILNINTSDKHRLGIIRTEYGFMITSVHPVFDGGNKGILGYLIMGRYLEESIKMNSGYPTEEKFNVIDINDKLSPVQSSALDKMLHEKQKALIINEAQIISIYFLIPDMDGKDSILIEESFPSIIEDTRRVVRTSLLIVLIVIPVIMYIIWYLLGRYVLKPVNKLKVQINTIAQGDYKNEHKLDSKDEIGTLSLFIENMAKTIDSRNEDLKSANRKLEILTITDGLTGIYNRRHFDDVMKSEWSRAKRSGLPLSVIMCDIDFFKKYNDTYGHQAGDECLIMIAIALKGMIHREGDKVFRYGGEEFIALLPNTPMDAAVQIAISFLKAVTGLGQKHEYSPDHGIVTISAGVSSVIPDKETESGYLIGLADNALYKSKQNGRNRVNSAEGKANEEVIFTEHIVK